jgi:hypothetical protein
MSDTTRIDQLEQADTERRAALVREAATRAGWHNAELAAKAIDLTTIQTPQGAAAAVRTYAAENSWVVQGAVTRESLERQWGQELLDGLERGGR